MSAALRERGYDPDAALDASQRADSAAYTALITERLNVALLYSWWVDDDNYEIIRNEYAGKLPIPLCYYLPWSMRRKVHSQAVNPSLCVLPSITLVRFHFSACYLLRNARHAVEAALPTRPVQLARRNCINPGIAYSYGESALEAISVRYGDRSFFHGSVASGIDATAFAYLAAVLLPPLPSDHLRQVLLSPQLSRIL